MSIINDEEKPQKQSLLKKRSFRFGSMATIFTAIFIAIIIVVNIGVTMLSNRFPLSIDLTSKKTFNVSQKSVDFIKKINEKITIYVLSQEEAYLGTPALAPCAKIMDQYPQHNPNISIQYIDLTKDPTFETNYPKEALTQNSIIVSSGKRYKVITTDSLLVTATDSTTGQTNVTGDNTEQELDSAIDYVTSEKLPIIMVTTGHGEGDSADLQTLLSKNNYTVESKNISTDGIDAAATSMAIVSPTTDFTSDEIKKLDSFMTNNGSYGKSLVVFFDPGMTILPNLEDFIAEWGIKVGAGAVYDKTNAFSTGVFHPFEGSYDTETVGSLTTGIHADIINTRPVTLLFDTKGTYTTKSVLATMNTSRLWNPGVINDTTIASINLTDSDKPGPFTVIAKSTRAEVSNNVSVSSTILVSGSYQFIANGELTANTFANADIILNSINKMGGFVTAINIVPKDRSTTTLTLTAGQAQGLEILFICIIPLAMIILGFVVWFRRRNL